MKTNRKRSVDEIEFCRIDDGLTDMNPGGMEQIRLKRSITPLKTLYTVLHFIQL